MTKSPSYSVSRPGFTFTEVVIAILIIGVVLVPILWFMTTSHRNTRLTINEINASNIASEFMESIRSIPFDLVGLQNGEIVHASGIDQAVYNLVFGKAVLQGMKVYVPEFPPGWSCYLKIEPMMTTRNLPPGLADPVIEHANLAAAMLKISIRVSWKEGDLERHLDLITARGRF